MITNGMFLEFSVSILSKDRKAENTPMEYNSLTFSLAIEYESASHWHSSQHPWQLRLKVDRYGRMDIILFGSYTRFSISVIKWNTQRAKITIYPFHLLIPFPSYWINELTNKWVLHLFVNVKLCKLITNV